MKLLEYQAKALLAMQSIAVPHSQYLADDGEMPTLPYPYVLKVQIPAGGRGKAGGIRTVRNKQERTDILPQLWQGRFHGHRTEGLLAEQRLDISRELYLALLIDRAQQGISLIAHRQGGVDIEQAASEASPLWRVSLEAPPTLQLSQQLLDYYEFDPSLQKPLHNLVANLYEAFTTEDMLLLEINPLALTRQGQLICADAKIELDDAAAYRHGDHWPKRAEATAEVILHKTGTIGSMANGAGLAMATVDAIATAGALPANFLDIGGGTSSDKMSQAFARLARLPKVRGIVVNIFGGITRCDDVARAIIEARSTVKGLPPLYIRLTGTNETAGRELLAAANIPLYPSLAACVDAAVRHV